MPFGLVCLQGSRVSRSPFAVWCVPRARALRACTELPAAGGNLAVSGWGEWHFVLKAPHSVCFRAGDCPPRPRPPRTHTPTPQCACTMRWRNASSNSEQAPAVPAALSTASIFLKHNTTTQQPRDQRERPALALARGGMSRGFGVGVGARDGARSACEGRRATHPQPARGPCSCPVRSP